MLLYDFTFLRLLPLALPLSLSLTSSMMCHRWSAISILEVVLDIQLIVRGWLRGYEQCVYARWMSRSGFWTFEPIHGYGTCG